MKPQDSQSGMESQSLRPDGSSLVRYVVSSAACRPPARRTAGAAGRLAHDEPFLCSRVGSKPSMGISHQCEPDERAVMKRFLAIVPIVLCMAGASGAFALDAKQVRATLKRVGDWQLAHPVDFGTLHWAVAPLLDGLIDANLTTGDSKYLAAVVRAGMREGRRPGPNAYRPPRAKVPQKADRTGHQSRPCTGSCVPGIRV